MYKFHNSCFLGNVFIHRNPKFLQSPESGLESCDDDEEEYEEPIIYKIGRNILIYELCSPKRVLSVSHQSMTPSNITELYQTTKFKTCPN